MKKTLTAITLLAGAVSGYSQQGAISFNAYAGGSTGCKIALYNTSIGGTYAVSYGGFSVTEVLGNSAQAHENPPGLQTYTGAPLSGTGYDAELLVGPAGISTPGGSVVEGTNGPVGLLPFGGSGQTGGSVAQFKTGATTVGFISANEGITLQAESWFAPGMSVSVALAAWNNEGGTVTSLAAAQAANANSPGSDPWGISNVAQTGALTTPPATGVALPTTLESFALGVTTTPEPSTIALGVMGASALLFRRRK
jgi:hypothetical protein